MLVARLPVGRLLALKLSLFLTGSPGWLLINLACLQVFGIGHGHWTLLTSQVSQCFWCVPL